MSMRSYAVNDYGMILDTETAKTIWMKITGNTNKDIVEDYGMILYGYDLYDREICECIGEFAGEATPILDNGVEDWGGDSESYCGDSILYISLIKYPKLFEKAYNSIDDIVYELKQRLGEYLPDDFDYRSKIRHIVGTYLG